MALVVGFVGKLFLGFDDRAGINLIEELKELKVVLRGGVDNFQIQFFLITLIVKKIKLKS